MAVGRLSVVATPIGNLADLTPRAAQALTEATVWFVEDTRVSGRLASHLGIKRPMRVLNDHTPAAAVERYAAEIAKGACAALLSDGGAPGVSDPGTELVEACVANGVDVVPLPGPSAPIAALMVSGFYAQRFAFLGFLPRKPGPMRAELAVYAESPYTLVVFESPHRIDKLLEVAHSALGARRYTLCRELTKAFEQIHRGRLPEVPDVSTVLRRGEFTVVFEGKRNRVVES